MDICTLIMGTALATPAIGCFSTMDNCHADRDGQRMLCIPTPCQTVLPPPTYECKRPDGTVYTYTAPPDPQSFAR